MKNNPRLPCINAYILTQTVKGWDDSRLWVYAEELSNYVGIINQSNVPNDLKIMNDNRMKSIWNV